MGQPTAADYGANLSVASALLGERFALVTGVARGNGEKIARAMAEQGAEVALVDMDGEAAQAVSKGHHDNDRPAESWFPDRRVLTRKLGPDDRASDL